MNKPYVKNGFCGLKDSKMILAMLASRFNGEAKDNVTTVQRTVAKEREWISELSYDCPQDAEWTRSFSKGTNYLLSPYSVFSKI